jgi:hypothetical protein
MKSTIELFKEIIRIEGLYAEGRAEWKQKMSQVDRFDYDEKLRINTFYSDAGTTLWEERRRMLDEVALRAEEIIASLEDYSAPTTVA